MPLGPDDANRARSCRFALPRGVCLEIARAASLFRARVLAKGAAEACRFQRLRDGAMLKCSGAREGLPGMTSDHATIGPWQSALSPDSCFAAAANAGPDPTVRQGLAYGCRGRAPLVLG